MPDGGLSAGAAYQSGKAIDNQAYALYQQLRNQFFAQGLGGDTGVNAVGRIIGTNGPASEYDTMRALWDTQLKPKPGESAADWYQRVNQQMTSFDLAKGVTGQGQLAGKWNALTKDEHTQAVLKQFIKTDEAGNIAPADQQAPQAGAGQAGAGDWQARIDAFYKAMMVPVEQDPHVQQILQSAASAGSTAAYGRGIEGPGQALAATQAAQNAAYQEQARRQGLALQAAQLGSGNQLGLQGLQLQAQQLQYQNDLNQRMYQGAQANRGGQQLAGAIQGGIGGATAGAAFGPYGAVIGGVAGAGLGLLGASSQQPVAPPNMQFGAGLRNA